jgi:hypothetical protein
MVDTEQLKVAGSPEIVLACADCQEVGPIMGTRWVERDQAHEPLCAEDFVIRARVWHGTDEEGHLHLLGPASMTDEHGELWVRRLCPRCDGAGRVEPFQGTCFACWGYRWTYISPKGVRRTLRWSATFQANRVPKGA